MRPYIILCCFLLLSISGPVGAQEHIVLDTYTHTVELDGRNSYHRVEILVNASHTRQIMLNLPPRAENINVIIDEIDMPYVLEEKKGLSVLNTEFPENTKNRHFIEITYDTTYPIFELDNRVLYRSGYIPNYKTSRFIYILKLPVGYIIPDDKDVSFFINPGPENIYSDGQRIILLWEQRNVNTSFEVSALMEPAASTSISGIVWGVILIILVGAGMYFYSGRSKKETITYPALVEHEKVIVDLLTKAPGRVMWQKQLQVESGFSKVKVSRLLKSLENRGVIKKEVWGNTNKIHLVAESSNTDGEQ